MCNEFTTDAVVIPEDGAREAAMGEVAKLPVLGKALLDWANQIRIERPADLPTVFEALKMQPNGLISRGGGSMRMTYRVFGGLLRDYCAPPRNVARCLHRLTAAPLAGSEAPEAPKHHSPRSLAYNDYLKQGAATEAKKTVYLRTRELPYDGANGRRENVIVGQVTPTHSRTGSDDVVFIEKLHEAFPEELLAMRASHYRGIEVSELRAVIPDMRVEMAPGEWWSGYLTVRNSEVGAASWSVSAGLYKELDKETVDAARRLGFEGATLSIEANERIGVHSGKKVAERVTEALSSAKALLGTLTERASKLAGRDSIKEAGWIVGRLATALKRVGGGDDLQDQLLGALAMQALVWEKQYAVMSHEVVTFLGQVMTRLTRRGQTYPLERLAGRVLMHGVDAALDKLPEYSDVEADE